MRKGSDKGRINLDDPAKEAVNGMMAALHGQEESIRVTSSKLVSWIVKRYSEAGFVQDREAIIQAHFNSKDYLKRVIDGIDSATDVTEALEAALKRVRSGPACEPAPKKRVQRKASGDASPAVEAENVEAEIKDAGKAQATT